MILKDFVESVRKSLNPDPGAILRGVVGFFKRSRVRVRFQKVGQLF